jgi:hypothetical protein
LTPASIIPVFGSQRPYADLNFAGGSFGLAGQSVSDITRLPGFTFTRASLAMGYDATGKLVYGPNNLCLQSQTATTTWTQSGLTATANAATAPDGTATANLLTEDTGSSHQLNQGITLAPGYYVWSAYLKAGARTWAALGFADPAASVRLCYFNLATGELGDVGTGATATITPVGDGWYRCSMAMLATPGNRIRIYMAEAGSVSYVGNGTSGLYMWGAQLEAVTYQTTPSTYYPTTTAAYYGPRLVYDPVTLASQGILVEEARTNSLVQSQDFATTWAANRASVTVNATTSPDGTSNADKLVEDATASNTHRVFGAATTTAVPWTYSVFAKADTRSWLYLRLDRSTGGTPHVWFNVSAGTVGTAEPGWTASIQNVGNGWYRCIATIDAALAGSGQPIIGLAPSDGVFSYTGDGTSGLFIWQAQLEAGTGASSPIPTTTAAVTRAADVAAVTGLTLAAPLTMVTGFAMALVSTATRYLSLIDAGSGSRELLNYLSGVSIRRAYVRAGGAAEADVPAGSAVTVGQQWSMASRFETNNVNLAASGTLGTADTSATMPTGLVNLHIGSSSTGTASANGTISRIRIYNRALPDAQLQSLTT